MADLPYVEELPPGLTPWDAARHLATLPHLLLLESAAPGHPLGRHSFVTADPVAWIQSRGREIDIRWRSRPSEDLASIGAETDPFAVLGRLLSAWPTPTVAGLPPFQGGLAGLFGYDLCHHLEHLPRPRWNEFASPDLAVGLYDCVLAFNHETGRGWLLATGLPDVEIGARQRRAQERAEVFRRQLLRSPAPYPQLPIRPAVEPALSFPVPGQSGVTSNFEREGYLGVVRRAVEYIHAGDCFQVNLSQRLLAPWRAAPLELYARLRDRNPAPFAGYLDGGVMALVSASPERFLKADSAGAVETRPIKGTRPRGATRDQDEKLRNDLLRSIKDRAENVMIVDLLRNDLGRSCAYGSIAVTALCQVESHPTVHHLVSEVRGRLRSGLGPLDLIRGAFPGGSVTGAPKVRAMEIIAELEPTARGAYCGSLGYIGCDGALDTSILIRTFTVSHGWAQFPVGGGVVADSDPAAEYAETLHKAAGLLRALAP
jgi:para-aminobenzoate synthetase component 1